MKRRCTIGKLGSWTLVTIGMLASCSGSCRGSGDARFEKASPPTSGTERTQRARVVGTVARLAGSLVTISTDGGTVIATPEHPFARMGHGWTPARELVVGDQIRTARGGPHVVLRTRVQDLEKPVRVYNLTIDPGHSYYAGVGSLLVHNGGSCSRPARLEDDEISETSIERRHGPPPGTLQVNDSEGNLREENCAYCTQAAAHDLSSVSTLIARLKTLEERDPPPPPPVLDLSFLGIREPEGEASGPRVPYEWKPHNPTYEEAGRQFKLLGLVNKSTTSSRKFRATAAAERFMRRTPEDTFAVAVEQSFSGPGGIPMSTKHMVLAIRKADHSLQYIDFQQVPPIISTSLPGELSFVAPLDVEWRDNQQITAAVQWGTRVPVL